MFNKLLQEPILSLQAQLLVGQVRFLLVQLLEPELDSFKAGDQFCVHIRQDSINGYDQRKSAPSGLRALFVKAGTDVSAGNPG